MKYLTLVMIALALLAGSCNQQTEQNATRQDSTAQKPAVKIPDFNGDSAYESVQSVQPTLSVN
jgi:hypothetical protein